MIQSIPQLPRLLYLGDVPVESSYHGSTLLYRLLQDYPADRLQIIEAGLDASLSERRFADVAYRFSQLPLRRLQYSRLARAYATGNLFLANRRARKFQKWVTEFKPQAVLTVTNGVSWISAAEVASKRELPLHLICHDEWTDSIPTLPFLQNWKERVFRDIYRTASSRLCVSPFMVESFERRYGVRGSVLYPSRAKDALVSAAPPERLGRSEQGLVFAYAGSVYTSDVLRLLAECIKPLGGKLLIFGPLTREQAVASGLDGPNIAVQGLLGAKELISRLRQEADVLFVPMSFAAGDRSTTEISFPSKLTDYTAVGLPLLIHGPEYCSAVRWARENPGVAEVVTDPDAGQLIQGVKRLASHPEYLLELGRRAIEVGDIFFSHEKAWRIFQDALVNAR